MNTPKIRFKGYTDAWEQRKLGDYVDIVSGDAPSKFEEGNELYVKVDDLNYNLKYVTDSQSKVANHKSIKKASKGSVVFPKRGAAIMTNKVRILAEDSYMDTNMMALSSDRIDSEFLYNIISKEGLYKIADTSTIPQINNKHIEPYEVMLPDLEEQKRIGEFFEEVDSLITLHQRKCDSLNAVKKYMLQKMFPKQGEKVPEIRFKGFTGDWEQRKLGDIADVTKLAGFEFTEHVVYSDEGNIIALRGLNIKNGQLVLDDVKYIDGSNFSKLSRSKLFINDIMFTYVGTVGEVAIIRENDRFYLAPNVSRIRVQSNDSPRFISHYMRTESFYRHIIFPLIATSSQPALSMENIRKFEICLPKDICEQEKIGRYFEGLDNLIALHQNKADSLKELKKFMLQNMFP